MGIGKRDVWPSRTRLRFGLRRVRGAPDSKPKPGSSKSRTLAGDARKVSGVAVGVGAELLKLVREMLVIPAQIWLAIAEVAGAAVLFAWRRIVLPGLGAVLALARAAYRLGLRHVTPARAVAAVCLVAIVSLAASQWVDYRTISVGTDAYSGDLAAVAPAPEVNRQQAGDAHLWAIRAARGGRARRAGAGAQGPAAGGEAADCGRGCRDRDQRRGGRAEGARRGQRRAHLRGRRGAPARGLLAPDRGRRGADRGRPAPAPLSATGTGGIERRDDRGPRPRARAPAARSRRATSSSAVGRGARGERPVDGEGSVSGAST